MKLNENSISYSINHSTKLYHYQFRYLTKETPLKISPVYENISGISTTKVAKYYNDRLICVYNSLVETDHKNGFTNGITHRYLDTGIVYHGFTFKSII